MMKKKLSTGILAAACIASLAACGSKTQTQETTAAVSETETAAAKETDEEAEETKNAGDSADDKKLSGKVVVYMPSPSGLNEKYVADFEEKTGVKVELFEGTTGEILARLEAEKDNPVADVVVT